MSAQCKTPQRGHRFTRDQIAEILKEAAQTTLEKAASHHGCSSRSILRWRMVHGDLVPATVAEGREADENAAPGSAMTERAAAARETPSQDRVRRLTIEIKQESPSYGPAQIQAYLRRFHGLKVTVKVVARILVEAGYPLQKRKAKEPEATQRFEMTRPNELWQIDVLQFRVIEQTVYLLHAIDDYSRFSVAHALLTTVRAQDVIALLGGAMRRHGKPEALLSDRGPQFSAFRGMTELERWLQQELIDHIKARAYHPQTVGKLEALNSTLHEEVLDQCEFSSLWQAREHLARWFRRYSHERPHLGIGGLVPADRYFGREELVREQIARAIAAGGRDLRADALLSADRAAHRDCLILQLRLVSDQLELWFAGKQVRLG